VSVWLASAWLVALTAAPPATRATDAGGVTGPDVVAAGAPITSLWAPPRPRGLSRVEAVTRPFLGLVGNSWGAVSGARVEHYFERPFLLGVELAPLAIAVGSHGAGAISHLRVHAAWVTDLVAVGVGVGARLRRYDTRAGVSLASTLRLGALDGLNLSLSYVYNVARNLYTGRPTLGFSNVAGAVAVPLTPRLAVVAEAALSLDVWVYATLGLRQRLVGEGGPGTWFVSAAFGIAWVSDRTICAFEGEAPCTGGSALSYGPTIAVGVERRF
jgi:hypothetical protein